MYQHTTVSNNNNWGACPECKGRGKRHRRLSKKARLLYQKELEDFHSNDSEKLPPKRPKGQAYLCKPCKGSGLITQAKPTESSEHYPNVSIIGGGIGGVALAVACLHRGIPFQLYERDNSFNARAQGYGLTLQQASSAIHGLGITSLDKGIISTRHIVHDTDGNIIGEWGVRKWGTSKKQRTPKRTNIHIARQALRHTLLKQLEPFHKICWNHQLVNIRGNELTFLSDEQEITYSSDLIVGADGIRSTVRRHYLPEATLPLQYLGCIVILGICPLSRLAKIESELLDSATVFQTANGHERIYMMPYSAESIMWQLSFPIAEEDAIALSKQGSSALKAEACRRTLWHSPVPEIMSQTEEVLISGYPVYDRKLLQPHHFDNQVHSTLIGDAAHPMSPFKGQGANQALLDALSLARKIQLNCRPQSNWREIGIRQAVLYDFEEEMLSRSAVKVRDSSEAARFLHSEAVLHPANEPRGRIFKILDT